MRLKNLNCERNFFNYKGRDGDLKPVPYVGGKKEKILRFSAKQNHNTIIWAKGYEFEKILESLGYDLTENFWEQTITKGKA